jgi:hypothetical protein
LLLTLLVTALAKGASVLPGYSIDEYRNATQPDLTLAEQVAQKEGLGRLGSALVTWVLSVVELDRTRAQFFFVACAIFGSSLFSVLLVRHWHLGKPGWLAASVACMAANHPYTAELFTFRSSLGGTILPFAIVAVLLIPGRWPTWRLVGGSAMFAVALSMYQVALHFLLMAALLGAAIWLVRYLTIAGAAGGRLPVRAWSVARTLQHRHVGLLSCTLAGTLLYLVLTRIAAAGLEIPLAQGTELVSFGGLGQKATEVWDTLSFRLSTSDPLVAPLAQRVLSIFLLGALAGPLLGSRVWRRPRSLPLLLAVAVLLATSLVWTLGLNAVRKDFWPTPRVMSHAGLLWGGALAITYRCSGPLARRGLALLSLLVVLSFVGSNNRIFSDQSRLNRRDALRATRILQRLERLDGFHGVDRVAVDGGHWGYPLRFKTLDHDQNTSAFAASWAKVDIFRERLAYDLTEAADEPAREAAARYCQEARPWPAAESVTVRDRLAVICLERP